MTSTELVVSGAPENLLPRLAIDLQRMRRHLSGSDADLVSDVLAQVLAIHLVQQQDLWGVTGTQGAGKTTLLCELYEGRLDHWLRGNPGRGEKAAVMVVEDPDRQDVQPVLHVLTEDDSAQIGRAHV